MTMQNVVKKEKVGQLGNFGIALFMKVSENIYFAIIFLRWLSIYNMDISGFEILLLLCFVKHLWVPIPNLPSNEVAIVIKYCNSEKVHEVLDFDYRFDCDFLYN
jgi:hypothetical protein